MDEASEVNRSRSRAPLVHTAAPFVGRSQELAQLLYALQQAMAGQPSLVLIAGESGIGKTRLLHELRAEALRGGVRVGYGRCYEDLALPYLPFIEAWRALREQISAEVERLLGRDGEVIARLLQPSEAAVQTAGSAAAGQGDQAKLRLFLAVSGAILALARHQPLLFVIDDLHWADRPSLDLFGHLAFAVADAAMREGLSILLIGSYRPLEPETHLARLIARLQREPICQTVALAGLTESEIHELVRGLGLARPSHQLLATVQEATQGNPLFIQEVVHHLVQQEALQERGGYLFTAAAPADLPLPEQVTGAILARTRGLSQACRQALTLAACLGDRFSLPVLGAVSGLGEDALLELLEEGVQQRLLLSEGQAFQFAHPLIRQAFYRAPSAARRQRLHAQLASALQRLYADSLEGHVLEIAHHLIRAGPAAPPDSVIEYARRGGDQAFALFAWGEAARYYEAALAAAGMTPRLSVQERATLHFRAGLALQREQDTGPCLDHYEKAIAAYRQAGDLSGLARALMEKARTSYRTASYGALIEVQPLEEVLEALGDGEAALCGGILAILSQAYRVAKQTAVAKEMAGRALEIGQRLHDERLCAEASFALGLVQAQSLHVRNALESWRSALRHARQAGDLWLQGLPLTRMPHLLISLGQLDEAEAVAQEACELTRRTQDWGDHSLALSSLTFVAVARGDFATAERRAHETLRMVWRSRYPWGGSRALFALACARALRGAWEEAADSLDMLVEPGRVFERAGPIVQGFVRVFRQLLRVHSGAAAEPLEPLVAELEKSAGIDSYALAPFCAVVELGDLLSKPAMVEYPYQVLSIGAERGIVFSSANGWVFMLPRVLGVAATLNRWWDVAEAHLQAAIDVAGRANAQPELGRSYLDYARMLAARGRKPDRRRAVELVKRAIPIFQELGMAPFVQRAAQLAASLRSRVALPAPRRDALPDQLTEREVAIVRQIAQGRTDQAIADDLVLAPATVGRHVAAIFGKLGVGSRIAVAAYAFDRGLVSPRSAPAARRTASTEPPEARRPTRQGKPSTEPLQILLVTDMEGSTALLQRLGDAQAHEVLRLYNAMMREALRQHHGVEITHTGDGLVAAFASVSSAIACAVAMQRAFAGHNRAHADRPIHVRVGLNAGEPIAAEGGLFGTAVYTAFRICARAQAGQILVSEVIRQLAAGTGFAFVDRGRVTLKGFSGRFRVYEVPWARADI
jgi:class 3 adenylate cyclase/tetratricopeptide (TPR) repeat protein/type II secretory pathway predicted ATPase ExeA